MFAGCLLVAIALAAVWVMSWTSSGHTRLTPLPQARSGPSSWPDPPRPTHVIIVIEENKNPWNVIGASDAPYINSLARRGALFTNASGIAHPSQPNYIALLTGTPNADGDDCPERTVSSQTPSLAGSLRARGLTFSAYSESMPTPGYTACTVPGQPHGYARKHNPSADFVDVPPSENLPLTSLPSASRRLPTVAFVVPNLADDMHDGSVATGDAWLRTHIGPIVEWAQRHETLVIVTWDESDESTTNRIPTIFVGQPVKPGRYDEPIDHYRILRTIEAFYSLPTLGGSSSAMPIVDCWR